MRYLRNALEQIYLQYNKHELIHPDPLEFLYNYQNKQDQEIVGLIVSSIAYGKVSQILVSAKKILTILGDNPRELILRTGISFFQNIFEGFKHRFTSGEEIVQLLIGIKETIKKYDSLENCFISHLNRDTNYVSAITGFATELVHFFPKPRTYLIPSPAYGSACKRLMLYLRWMIRSDDVDPGCWEKINPKILIVPLDTHMYSISKKLGFTDRKSANMKTAMDITEAFKKINKNDPVKYDFALTRFGIRNDFDYHQLFDIIKMHK